MVDQSFDIKEWIQLFSENLVKEFSDRIICVGLQGSYGRGEQTSESDIDVVAVLDEVSFADLQTYRKLIDGAEVKDKLCGFIAGKEELLAWEKYDLLQLYLDTKPYVGSLDFLKDTFTAEDVRQAVRVGACNIYHAASHNFLYERDDAILKSIYKSARFTVRMKYYCETGNYLSSMRRLVETASSGDKIILEKSGEISSECSKAQFDELSRGIIEWAGNLIKEIG